MAAGINGFSVGKDLSIQVVTSSGTVLAIAGETAAEFRAMYNERNSHGLDGINRFIPIPAGWEGTIELDRRDPGVEDFYAAQETGYYQGQGIAASTITQNITNPDGSMTSWQYTGVMFTFREAGNWRGDDKVTQRMDFKASQRQALNQ